MGRSIVYCVICGCPFVYVLEISSGYDTTISPPLQTKHLGEFRIIGKSTFTHDPETSNTPFSVSPPAHDAEFRCCFIQGRESSGSHFSCWKGQRWKLLEKKGAPGTVLYPLHDTCITTVRGVAQYNGLCDVRSKNNDNTMDYTSLQSYYEALLRLHDRLTSWPYEDPDAEEQLSRFHAVPFEYGSYALEWEHRYYGAARFADGSDWEWVPGWEWLCADPSIIPDLTSYILSKLPRTQSLSSPTKSPPPPTITSSPPSTSPLAVLETLSTELIHLITLHAGASASLRLRRCSKTLFSKIPLPQSFWRTHLLTGSLIDYLWDLDRALCIQKDGQGGHWDWKALVRKLRKPYILENAVARSLEARGIDDGDRTVFEQRVRRGGEFADAPMGLQNRCRLVRIVRDVERMDQIEASERVIEEDGERVKRRRYDLLFSDRQAARG